MNSVPPVMSIFTYVLKKIKIINLYVKRVENARHCIGPVLGLKTQELINES